MPNTRDLGGIINKDGLKIKSHKLIRSGRLYDSSENDLKTLYEDYDVRHIVDFRIYEEVDERPDQIYKDTTYSHLTAMADKNGLSQDEQSKKARYQFIEDIDNTFRNAPETAIKHMENFYRDLVNSFSIKQYSKFLLDLIDAEHATLWHCSLGKDRAGIATVLILECLNVDKETILEDYLYSTECLFKEDKPINSIQGYFDYAHIEYVKAWYDEVIEMYGDINDLLKLMGISEKEKQLLKDKYLEK